MRWGRLGSGILTMALAAAIATPAAAVDPDRAAFRRPQTIPFPENAPYSLLVATLGKMVFFDPRVSKAQNMSCATCHNPSFGWEVPVERAIGGMNLPLTRQASTILNMAWVQPLFWDGRAPTLEIQAAGPMTAPMEMGATLPEVVARLIDVPAYRDGFNRAFPGKGLTEETLLTAVATYERTVVSGWSPFDKWVEGDESAISEAAKRGFAVFVGPGRCAVCHSGWNLTDNQFYDIGLDTDDIGRAAIEPNNPRAMHAFKTPTLRNVALRSPYGHNGRVDDLRAIIDHYVSGGMERPSLSEFMQPLALSEGDIDDLIAFLHSLTADEAAVPAPILPVH